MYALVISSRSFSRLNSISAILCSRVLCSSGICSFLSRLAYYREVDSFLRELSAAVALKSLRCDQSPYPPNNRCKTKACSVAFRVPSPARLIVVPCGSNDLTAALHQLTRQKCAVLDSQEALRHNRHPLRGCLKSWSLPWEKIYPRHSGF